MRSPYVHGHTVADAVRSAAAEPFCRFPTYRTIWRFARLTRYSCTLHASAGKRVEPRNATDDLIRRLREKRRLTSQARVK